MRMLKNSTSLTRRIDVHSLGLDLGYKTLMCTLPPNYSMIHLSLLTYLLRYLIIYIRHPHKHLIILDLSHPLDVYTYNFFFNNFYVSKDPCINNILKQIVVNFFMHFIYIFLCYQSICSLAQFFLMENFTTCGFYFTNVSNSGNYL